MTHINRRQLGKRILGGLATDLLVVPSVFASKGEDFESASFTEWKEVHPGVWKARIGQPETVTPVKSRLVSPLPEALARMPRTASAPIPLPAGAISSRGVTVVLPLQPYEEIYGFGLQFFAVQHRAQKLVMRVNADPKFGSGDSHAPVPFYVTNKGYGILIDTARYATFYCGEVRRKPQAPLVSTDSGVVPTATSDLYAKKLADGQSSTVIVDVPSSQGVDVYVFGGPSMRDAVRRYNLFSGGGVNPPEWGLGFWYRAQSNATDVDITRLMQEFRDRKIPCDVIGLEGGWQTHSYSCTFAWHKERFPQPSAFVRKMQAQDLHVNVWEHGFTHPSSELFSPLLNHSGDQGVWGGLVPDFEEPAARKIFGDFHGNTLVDIGIDGFKLDECDNSDYTGGWSFPEISRFPSGIDGEQMHSLFGLRYQKTLWEQYQKRGKSTYSLVRSSGALASPYPFVLYSDLYDHRQFVRALVNSSFSGLLWCPEVRDAKSEEDLIRRLQTVVFSPLAMINGWYIPNPPWKQLNRKLNSANTLMPDWQALEGRCREILGWRMQIIPYLRAAFSRYAQDGTPPFRALALDWPDHPELAAVDDAWMVGDRMLVAPLFAGEAFGRSLTLPPGDWHNFWTGEKISGGTKTRIAATERNIPVFVKAGSVLPLATITNSVAVAESRNLEVRVFGDGHLPFELLTVEDGVMRLSWDRDVKHGKVEQSGKMNYQVVGWSWDVHCVETFSSL